MKVIRSRKAAHDPDRFPAFAKPASAGEGRSDKIMRKI
jgi:hypothetical protein